MTLTAIAKACNGQLFGYDDDSAQREVTGIVIDSRKVEKDYLFIATVGERVDGHNFIDDVFNMGAMAVVCEKTPTNCKGPYILVERSFVALKDIAKWYRMQLDIKVVGITGSVGKTSTKEFISSVLSRKYNVLKTEGNFNNEIGLPLTILKIRAKHDVAVLEMGISKFGEMHRLSEIAKPDICVITNIGQCHLENLGTRKGVFNAKTELFDFMSKKGRVCINGDDDMLVTLQEIKGSKPIKFGMNSSNDVFATDLKTHGLFGSTCDIHVNKNKFHTTIPLPGAHMVFNAMAATSVGTLLHMTFEEIASGIEMVQPVGGRSNIIQHEKYTIIDDCYNANPESMKAAIDLLNVTNTRKIAILGDMFELGTNEKTLHKKVGTYAASRNVDVLIFVGKLSSYMYDGASECFHEIQDSLASKSPRHKLLYFETRDALIEALPAIIKEKDTILVKASHGMQLEHVVNALMVPGKSYQIHTM